MHRLDSKSVSLPLSSEFLIAALTNEFGVLVNALLETGLPEVAEDLEIVVGSRSIWLQIVELHHAALA